MSKSVLIVYVISIGLLFVLMLLVSNFSYQKGYNMGYGEGKDFSWATYKIRARDIVTNPLENMPSINPFEGKFNPFTEVYKNPFE